MTTKAACRAFVNVIAHITVVQVISSLTNTIPAGAYKLPDAWAQKHARAYTAYAQPMVSGSARFLEEHNKGAPAACCPDVHGLVSENLECCLQHLCRAQGRILAQRLTCSVYSSHMSAVQQALPPHQGVTALQPARRILLGQEHTTWPRRC